MAELSNDPAGQLSPTITYDINHKGSVLATLAKAAGVRRFVTCLHAVCMALLLVTTLLKSPR